MLSNLLRLVIIVCIHGIKATKRWFRESPTVLGGCNLRVPTAYLGPKVRQRYRGDCANRIRKKYTCHPLLYGSFKCQFQRIRFFPFFSFFKFKNWLGDLKSTFKNK